MKRRVAMKRSMIPPIPFGMNSTVSTITMPNISSE